MTVSTVALAPATDSAAHADLRVESTRVVRGRDVPLFAVLTVANLAAIGYFLLIWLRYGDVNQHPVLFLLITCLIGLILVNQQGLWFLQLSMRRPRPASPPEGLRVAVVTTYVAGAEPLGMLERTLPALVAMDYPHDTWLLDESDDPEVRSLCAKLGVRHFSRANRPEYQTPGRFAPRAKYGNYNAWLDAVGFETYDVLYAFDTDHVPYPSCLMHTLGYLRDPQVGYVQAAQAYYNQEASFIARGAAEDTYAYYSAVQMASFGLGYPIISGGHSVHRMSALKEIDGFAQHHAEDLLATLRYRSSGWRGVYVPRILARGLTPVDWRGYLTQQRRWARSVLDIKLRRWSSYANSLPTATRVMSFLHGINFMHRSAAGLGFTLILVWMLAKGGTHSFLQHQMLWPLGVLAATRGMTEVYRQKYYLDPERERGVHWRSALLEWVKWPWFLLALIDVLLDRKADFALTWKNGRRGVWPEFLAVQGGLAAIVAAAWAFNVFLRPTPHIVVRICAAAVLLTGLVLIATELRGFPAPWERRTIPPAPESG